MNETVIKLGKLFGAVIYLAVLSHGKSKPNTKHKRNSGAYDDPASGAGTIRDAKDNLRDIDAVKKYINKELGITISSY